MNEAEWQYLGSLIFSYARTVVGARYIAGLVLCSIASSVNGLLLQASSWKFFRCCADGCSGTAVVMVQLRRAGNVLEHKEVYLTQSHTW